MCAFSMRYVLCERAMTARPRAPSAVFRRPSRVEPTADSTRSTDSESILGGVWRSAPRRWSRRRRTVYVGDPRHCAVAVIGGNSFENLGFEMLKLDRYRPRDAYPECAVRPQAVGPRAGGNGLTHDRGPLGGDPRCCEPARLEGPGGNSLDQRGERLRLAGLAHVRSRTSGVPTQGVRPTTPAVKCLRRR